MFQKTLPKYQQTTVDHVKLSRPLVESFSRISTIDIYAHTPHVMFVFRLLFYESQIQCLCLCKYIDRCAQRYVYNSCIQIFNSNYVAMQSAMHNVSFDEQ